MASSDWWNIEWYTKSGTEDLDSSKRDKCKSLEAQVCTFYLGNYTGRQNNFQVKMALFCSDND